MEPGKLFTFGHQATKQIVETVRDNAKRNRRIPIPTDRGRPPASQIVLLAKADEDVAKDATGTFSIWNGAPNEETDTGVNVEAACWLGEIATGVRVHLAHNGFSWYVIAAEC